MQKDLIKTIIKKREQQADTVIMLELARLNGKPLPEFYAGAHIDVHLKSGLIRQYSLCGSSKELSTYRIGVLRDPNSRGASIEIHDDLLEGTEVLISEPRNLFPLVKEAKHSILIAGGIGITPILSMAYELNELKKSFELLYCGRSRESSGFIEELERSEFAEQVKIHFDSEHNNNFASLHSVLNNFDLSTHLYVCGPAVFIDWVIAFAKNIGMDDGQIHKEFFAADVDANGAGFEVVAKISGLTVQVEEGQSIANALKLKGVNVSVSCEQGVCGTCLCDVFEGIPDHRDTYLTDEEKQDNDQMTLCCSRSFSPKLVLDI